MTTERYIVEYDCNPTKFIQSSDKLLDRLEKIRKSIDLTEDSFHSLSLISSKRIDEIILKLVSLNNTLGVVQTTTRQTQVVFGDFKASTSLINGLATDLRALINTLNAVASATNTAVGTTAGQTPRASAAGGTVGGTGGSAFALGKKSAAVFFAYKASQANRQNNENLADISGRIQESGQNYLDFASKNRELRGLYATSGRREIEADRDVMLTMGRLGLTADESREFLTAWEGSVASARSSNRIPGSEESIKNFVGLTATRFAIPGKSASDLAGVMLSNKKYTSEKEFVGDYSSLVIGLQEGRGSMTQLTPQAISSVTEALSTGRATVPELTGMLQRESLITGQTGRINSNLSRAQRLLYSTKEDEKEFLNNVGIKDNQRLVERLDLLVKHLKGLPDDVDPAAYLSGHGFSNVEETRDFLKLIGNKGSEWENVKAMMETAKKRAASPDVFIKSNLDWTATDRVQSANMVSGASEAGSLARGQIFSQYTERINQELAIRKSKGLDVNPGGFFGISKQTLHTFGENIPFNPFATGEHDYNTAEARKAVLKEEKDKFNIVFDEMNRKYSTDPEAKRKIDDVYKSLKEYEGDAGDLATTTLKYMQARKILEGLGSSQETKEVVDVLKDIRDIVSSAKNFTEKQGVIPRGTGI